MLSYTSGTTGDPKGVKLTHKQMMTQIYVAMVRTKFDETDAVISYMPYAHSFEQCCFVLAVYTRMRTGYYSGDPI